jgi:hypothetical protein
MRRPPAIVKLRNAHHLAMPRMKYLDSIKNQRRSLILMDDRFQSRREAQHSDFASLRIHNNGGGNDVKGERLCHLFLVLIGEDG